MLNKGLVIGLIQKYAPVASPEDIAAAVDAYLEQHPEISVADGSITEAKLAEEVANQLEEIPEIKNALTPLTPAAAAGDVGKYMKVKTVADGKVTEYEFGTPSGGGGSDIDDTAGAGDTDKAWSADKLTTKFGVIEDLQVSTQTGYITSFKQGTASEVNGVVDETVTTRCYTGILDMKKGDSFTFSRSANKISTTSYLTIYDTTGTFIRGVTVTSGNTVTFDADGKFAINCILNSSVSATMQEAINAANGSFNARFDKTIKIVKTINAHSDEIVNLNTEINKIKGINLTLSDMSFGAYYAVSNGSVSKTSENNARYYPISDVSAFRGKRMKIWINGRRAGSLRSVGFCDSDGNVGNYVQETYFDQVADGGYYKVIIVDKDYMFFSCSSDNTKIRIEILNDDRSEIDGVKRYYHMSFDDVILCLKDLTTNESSYDTIFDNEFLAWCKGIHDRYGTTFSMYCYYADDVTSPTWTLENCTAAFASEFTENADWLKFGFHGYAPETTVSSRGKIQSVTDYTNTITQLLRITGSVNCIDRMPRLHTYTGTADELTAIRDIDLGFVGCIASADYSLSSARDSYYFDTDQNAFIEQHYYMYDPDTLLHFVKTNIVWNTGNYDSPTIENSAIYYNMNKYVEIFTHESQLNSTTKNTFDHQLCKLSYSHNPYFMMNLVLNT